MDSLIHFIQHLGVFGYVILFFIIFLESLPFTFFLPGDSLLFTTGFLAFAGYFNLGLLFVFLFVGSILGYMLSYFIGKKFKDFILQKGDSFWIKRRHIEATHNFFQKYGIKTIIIGRFVPVIRSFAPALAGAGDMPYSEFLRDTFVGGVLWTGGLLLVGFYLGKEIPGARVLLTPIIIIIILVSLSPGIYEYFRSRKNTTV